MITCKEATELAAKSQDTPITLGERIRLTLHLCICKLCNRYVRQLHFVKNAVRALNNKGTPHQLSPEAKQRIKTALKNTTNR